MVDEMTSFHKNEVWNLVELLAGRKPIGSKWVFKKKTNAEGKVEKYKAHLVAKGYSQVSRIDFGDIFSPIAKVTSIRLILFVVADFYFEVEQMDVKIAFPYGDLEEEIYMKQPEGFAVKGKKELGAIRIDCDNQSAIFLSKNPAYHSKTKHIDVQYHFVRDMIEYKKVMLVKVDTLKNSANALTKFVSSEKFSWCRETMGVARMDK
eukprot:PITA_29012